MSLEKTVDVKFPSEKDKVAYSDVIKGFDYNTYKFRAKKGQRLQILLRTHPYLFGLGIEDWIVLDRSSPCLNDQEKYMLPESGVYELRVRQTRNNARGN
ncbi:inhibitor of g-type lysozyme [Escherichia coli]|uniref:inhibitor of g-type lysozyme n=1 Tax=Escherichia coli TaxID=562 RepID=UPI00207B1CCC|nr:inhibitor of g-type lysozyme [Escherichia coli]